MILPQLHDDLVVAAAREAAPRRRPAFLLPVAAAVAAVVAVLVVRGPEPEREVAVPPPAAVSVPIGGVRPPLTLQAFTAGDRVCLGYARIRYCVPRPTVVESFDVHPAPVTFHVGRIGRFYVVSGVATANVDHVAVVAPEGERAQARMGEPRLEMAGGPRMRPWVAALKLDNHPGELKLTVTHEGAMDDVRIPPPRIPGRTYSLQRPGISLLERPARPRDAVAAAELRRVHTSRSQASTARVALRFQGRPIYAWVRRDGQICLSGIGGAACTTAESAVSDEPMMHVLQRDGDDVTAVGLIHDGPAAITLEREDGTKRAVAVVNNVFVFEDEDVVRLRWRGLDGPASMAWDP